MPEQEKCCEFCWHPPRRIEGRDGLHNDGCPMIDAGAMAEWKQGQNYGFADNNIEPWQYRYYTPAFILGWRVGKAEIDGMVDDAAQARC